MKSIVSGIICISLASLAGCSHEKPAENAAASSNDQVAVRDTTRAPGVQPATNAEEASAVRGEPTVDPAVAPRATDEPAVSDATESPVVTESEPSQARSADGRPVEAQKPLTPVDQGNGSSDLEITKRIRQAVTVDDSLSFTAKNAKIITKDGRVTLRGAVKTAKESATIEAIAKNVVGPNAVVNELEVQR